ncbi:MAG: hypothetical protein HYV67_02445 [Candidatus Taylorbacteria bacterium]|nr:hypothetical protein [Candidatus Taylorbacteria bacterium]
MNKSLKHSILGIIVASLVALPALVGFATAAQADVTSCLGGLLLSKTKSKIGTTVATTQGTAAQTSAEIEAQASGIQAVPVSDAGTQAFIKANTTAITALAKDNSKIAGDNAAQNTGSTIQRCIVEPLVTIMVRALLDKFTAATVNWINSGFQGSPLYVTNLQGFLAGAADQAAGQFIQGLGPIGSILCSPFDLQLRLSLGLQYSQPGYYQYIGCRLSDIQNNIQRAFTSGAWGRNGWDSWIQLTAYPQNNPYGAYLKAVDSIDASIAGTQFTLTKQLDFGKGFLSSVDPRTGKITTPGSLIEDQLSNTLGVEVQRVGLAKDLDAILGALVGQMINQVMGGLGGLAGASDSRSASVNYSSAVERASRQTVDAVIANSRQAQTLPDGFIMNTGTGTLNPTGAGGPTPLAFCTQFRNNIYGTNTGSSLIYVKVNGATTAPNATPILTSKTTAAGVTTAWTVADYNNLFRFCANINLTAPIAGDTAEFRQQLDDADTELEDANRQLADAGRQTGSPSVALVDREIRLGTAKLNQSHIDRENGRELGPMNAAGGFSYSDTKDGSEHWWTASLNQSEEIQTIRVRSRNAALGAGINVKLAELTEKKGLPISPSDATGHIVFQYPNTTSPPNFTKEGTDGNFTLTLNPPVTASAIVISKATRISLAEVKLFRPQEQALSFSPDKQEAKPNVSPASDYYNPTNRDFSNTFTLSAAQTQSGLKARLKLLGVLTSGAGQPVQFSSVFAANSLKINDTINDASIDTSQNSVIFKQNFSLTQGDSVEYTETGTISNSPGFNNSNSTPYLSYKLVMEIFKTVNGVDQSPIAVQTTTFIVR